VLASGFAGSSRAFETAAKGLHAWCRWMYATSAAVAYISPGVGRVLRDRGVPATKLHYIPMWADELVFRPSEPDFRSELDLAPDQVVLLYAGALGDAQGLTALIDACARVTAPEFVCLVAGSGIAEDGLRRRAAELGVTNVRFLGRVPQTEMTRLMAAADLSYIGLRAHASTSITMPSKTQAALAAAKAVLVAADGDLASIVKESGAGFAVGPGDVPGIAAMIEKACRLGRTELKQLGLRGRRYYERTFSAAEGVRRIEALLEHAAAGRSRRGH
jgi:colanic acid biosynthesis glycosyl transferase WcaI